ncbi:hypothetical protein AAVH_26182, partial [Aphelenchoides avenae]
MSWPCVNFLMFFLTYQLYFLFSTHTAIAFNRYTAFVRPTLHQQIWRDRSLKAIVVILAIVPLPGAILRFFYSTYLSEEENGYRFKTNSNWANQIGNFLSAAYPLISCLVTFCLELRTFWQYRNLSATLRAKHQKDFRLL